MNAGKGDRPRPMSVPPSEYAERWERVFGKREDWARRETPEPPRTLAGFPVVLDADIPKDEIRFVQLKGNRSKPLTTGATYGNADANPSDPTDLDP